MGKMIDDRRRRPIQAVMYKAGTCIIQSVTSGAPFVFAPDLEGIAKIYAVRSTARMRISAHDGTYTFTKEVEPVIDPAEEQLFLLRPGTRDRITMQADTVNSSAVITEVEDP